MIFFFFFFKNLIFVFVFVSSLLLLLLLTFPQGFTIILDWHLSHGVDINTKTLFGYTPLHYACKNERDPEVVRYLIAKGADVSYRTPYSRTDALTFACQREVWMEGEAGGEEEVGEMKRRGECPIDLAVLLVYEYEEQLVGSLGEIRLCDSWGTVEKGGE